MIERTCETCNFDDDSDEDRCMDCTEHDPIPFLWQSKEPSPPDPLTLTDDEWDTILFELADSHIDYTALCAKIRGHRALRRGTNHE